MHYTAGYSLADWNFRVLDLYDATSTGLSFTLIVVAILTVLQKQD